MRVAAAQVIFGMVLGFVLALPFAGFGGYISRVLCSVVFSLIAYSVLMIMYCHFGGCAHPGPSWSAFIAFGVALGGVGAAHLRNLWILVKKALQRRVGG